MKLEQTDPTNIPLSGKSPSSPGAEADLLWHIERRRRRLSMTLSMIFHSTVRYGLFKGMKLSPNYYWSCAERASMLLGLYEQEVQKSLTDVSRKYTTFINLGAGDGYYAVGVLVSGCFERSYCFEMSEKGRSVIRETAELNGVCDRLSIHGIADRRFVDAIGSDHLSKSVLLIDIEGGEFDLLDEEMLGSLKESIIFVELHEFIFEDASAKLGTFLKAARQFFAVSELTTSARDLSVFPELRQLADHDRWLICSENRPRLMTWVRLDPKAV